MEHHTEDCAENDGNHEVNLNIEFELVEDADGDFEPRAAAVRTHVHNVPIEAATQTLVMVASKMLGDHMAHTTFESCPSHELAHAMGRAAAAAFLIEAIKNTPTGDDVISTVIPNDISELLGD
jgi:hypothetical protein